MAGLGQMLRPKSYQIFLHNTKNPQLMLEGVGLPSTSCMTSTVEKGHVNCSDIFS
jgi:hypothetical protein